MCSGYYSRDVLLVLKGDIGYGGKHTPKGEEKQFNLHISPSLMTLLYSDSGLFKQTSDL